MLLRPIPEIRSECRLYAASSLKEGPRQQPNHISIQRTPSLQMNNLNGGLMGPKHSLLPKSYIHKLGLVTELNQNSAVVVLYGWKYGLFLKVGLYNSI